MRVLLLGAGASKSYDQSPTGQRMPVARDFFQTFDKLDLSANPWVLIGSLAAYVEDELGPGARIITASASMPFWTGIVPIGEGRSGN